jgi:hypothetical protein
MANRSISFGWGGVRSKSYAREPHFSHATAERLDKWV